MKLSNPKYREQVLILAGMFACTNMGQDRPSVAEVASEVRAARARPLHYGLESAVHAFCEPFMENDEHQRIFMEEGHSWVKTLRSMDEAEARRAWPDNFQTYDEAVDYAAFENYWAGLPDQIPTQPKEIARGAFMAGRRTHQ